MAKRVVSIHHFSKFCTVKNFTNVWEFQLLMASSQISCNLMKIQNCQLCNIVSPVRYYNSSLVVFPVIRLTSNNLALRLERSYSKGKEKGEKKKKGLVNINESEIAELVNVLSLKQDLKNAVDSLKSDYVKHLSLRSAAGSIETLPVELEGDTYTLQEIAQIGRKGPQLLVINLSSFPTALKNVLKAIKDSGMGLNPQQDGTTLFIPIPKVTREYRESLAKNAKTLFQKFKDNSRDIQNRYIREVKKKEKEVSSDLAHSVQQQIHALTEQFVSEAEKVMIDKQNELLGKD
uniref:Ribosome-recycling factor, mitochondrial n=1 Tax=Scapholeberis mucronata TaxID=202097 RepID=A0A4Y7NMR7_9CRUS|nr:EOG090X0DUK [Scapholeberis mucronata]SVE93887.1 EOG090X0DUK [Scapholeberis mucronata]